MKIGDKLYYKDGLGKWKHVTVEGETSRSWICFFGRYKINKKTLIKKDAVYWNTQFYTKEGMENERWIHENKYKIVHRLKYCTDINKLKRLLFILEN